MNRLSSPFLVVALAVSFMSGCIRTQNYHPATTPQASVFHYNFSDSDTDYGMGYLKNAQAYEAYVEFDARGSMYRDRNNKTPQRDAAVNLIKSVRFPNGQTTPRKI